MATEIRNNAQKLWGFAKYLATPVFDRIPEGFKPTTMDITTRDRLFKVLPDPASCAEERAQEEYASIELSFRSSNKISSEKAPGFSLLPNGSLTQYSSLFEPESYMNNNSDALQENFIDSLKDLRNNFSSRLLKTGAETFAIIIEAYQACFRASERWASAELLRAKEERELSVKEQILQMKAQQEMLTQQLIDAKRAAQEKPRPAGKTLPANYPRAQEPIASVQEVRVAPVEAVTGTGDQPSASKKVNILPFLPKGAEKQKVVAAKRVSPSPTRLSPGVNKVLSPSASRATPVSAKVSAKSATGTGGAPAEKTEKKEKRDKKASKKHKKDIAKASREEKKPKADVTKLLKMTAKQVCGYKPTLPYEYVVLITALLQIKGMNMSYEATKTLKRLARSYQEHDEALKNLNDKVKTLKDAPVSMWEAIDKHNAEMGSIKKQAAVYSTSGEKVALSPLERLREQTKANKERSLRAMASSESSEDSDAEERSVPQEEESDVEMEDPPTRRDIVARDPIPVPPKSVKRKRASDDEVEEEPPKKKSKKVQQGEKQKKNKTPRITTNEAFEAAKKAGILTGSTFRLFSSLYKLGPSQPQYQSSFASGKGHNQSNERYKYVLDAEFREAAANLKKPISLEDIPSAAVIVAQAAGRSICDSTAPVFTVRVANEPSGKNNSGADRAFFSGYVDQPSSSIKDVDLNEKMEQMFSVADAVREHCNFELDPELLQPYLEYSEEWPGYYPYSKAIEDSLPVYQAFRAIFAGKYNLKQMSKIVFPTEELSNSEPVTINSALNSALIRCAVFGTLNGRALPGTLHNGFVDTLTVHLPTVCKGLFDVDTEYLAKALQEALGLGSSSFNLPGLEQLMAAHRSTSDSPFPADKVAAAATVDDLRDVVNLFQEYQTLVRSYLDSYKASQVTDDEHFLEYVAPKLDSYIAMHNRLRAALDGLTELPTLTKVAEDKDEANSSVDEHRRSPKKRDEKAATVTSFIPPTIRLTPPAASNTNVRLVPAGESDPIMPAISPELLAMYRDHMTQEASRLDYHPALQSPSTQPVGFSAEGYAQYLETATYDATMHEETMDASIPPQKVSLNPNSAIPGLSDDSTEPKTQGDIDPEAAEQLASGFSTADLVFPTDDNEEVSSLHSNIPSLSDATMTSLD